MVDRSVWYHLPDELTERVMASLPASSVLACRCVCKHWNSLLRSHSFLRLSARLSRRSLWFIVYRSGHSLAAFSPLSHRWHRFPLPFLDPSLAVPLVSSRGLLCLLLRHSRYPTILVCNPLASSHRLLPSMCHIRYIDIVGMVFSTPDGDEASGFYRILVTGTAVPATHETVTELYDSRTGQWCLHCRSDQDFLQFWYESRAVWLAGFFYCLAAPVDASHGHRLIAYDLSNRSWEDLSVGMAPKHLRCSSLVVCGGRLLLAGKIVKDHLVREVCVWEVSWERKEWVKVAAMPDQLLSEFHSPSSALMQCQGHGDLLCFSTHRGWQSITYNLLDGTWRWLPENSECGRSHDQVIGRNNLVGLPFEPSLSARI